MKYKKYLLYFLVLVYVSGAIGFVLQPDFFQPFTPYTLLLTCFVFLFFQPINSTNYLYSFALIALIGFTSEVIGVKTGYIFGNYHYGNALGIKILEVPLVISINWALLAACSVLTASYVTHSRWKLAILASVIATLTDLLIEQVAPVLDFWSFTDGKAGFHNYLGWFLISFVAAFLFGKVLIKGDKRVGLIILSLQLLFFGVIFLLNL